MRIIKVNEPVAIYLNHKIIPLFSKEGEGRFGSLNSRRNEIIKVNETAAIYLNLKTTPLFSKEGKGDLAVLIHEEIR